MNNDFLGDKISLYEVLRDQYRDINAQAKELKAKLDALSQEIIGLLDQAGVTAARKQAAGVTGRQLTVTINEQEVPHVVDWDEVHDYIKRTDSLYLLERRLSSAAWRELHQSGQHVPGTEPFVRRTLSVTKR